jgi:Ni,Fe-hydrogenase I cytochrome b subunit
MYYSPALLFLDASAAVIMLVIASLSKGLGNALKIKRYYRLLYFSAGLVLTMSLCNAIFFDCAAGGIPRMPFIATLIGRFFAGTIAMGVSLRYWKWLFAEYIKK